jgi:hypothetical protein
LKSLFEKSLRHWGLLTSPMSSCDQASFI